MGKGFSKREKICLRLSLTYSMNGKITMSRALEIVPAPLARTSHSKDRFRDEGGILVLESGVRVSDPST